MVPIGGDSRSKARELKAWPLSVGTLWKSLGRGSGKGVPAGMKGRQDEGVGVGGTDKEEQEGAGGVELPWDKVCRERKGRPHGPDACLKLLLDF